MAPDGLRVAPHAEQVDLDRAAERVGVDVLARDAARVAHARVVDEDIDLAVRRDRLVDDALHVREHGDVARVGRRLATLRRDLGRVLLEEVGRARGERDVGAGIGERVCEHDAEAVGAAGDERRLAREIEHRGAGYA